MVAEVPGIRTAAKQTVQGSDLGGDRLQHVFRQRQGPDLLADGFGETRRGLAAVSYTHLTLPTICSV